MKLANQGADHRARHHGFARKRCLARAAQLLAGSRARNVANRTRAYCHHQLAWVSCGRQDDDGRTRSNRSNASDGGHTATRKVRADEAHVWLFALRFGDGLRDITGLCTDFDSLIREGHSHPSRVGGKSAINNFAGRLTVSLFAGIGGTIAGVR